MYYMLSYSRVVPKCICFVVTLKPSRLRLGKLQKSILSTNGFYQLAIVVGYERVARYLRSLGLGGMLFSGLLESLPVQEGVPAGWRSESERSVLSDL